MSVGPIAERRVAVIDYGVNNVGSVLNMLRRLDVFASAVSSPEQLGAADCMVLPGIGAFDTGMKNLRRAGLADAIQHHVADGTPILGICLGMQLLGRSSEEGELAGLGILPAETKKFDFSAAESRGRLKIPHMGWNEVEPIDSAFFAGFSSKPRFYFVHSYHVVCDNEADVAGTCAYGDLFAAAVRHQNVFGVQFHPEKSHRFGMQLLGNFLEMTRDMVRRA